MGWQWLRSTSGYCGAVSLLACLGTGALPEVAIGALRSPDLHPSPAARSSVRFSAQASLPLGPSSCPTEIAALADRLIPDLPSYANRISQRARRKSRSVDPAAYVLLAGRPELSPLPIEAYSQGVSEPDPALQQLFLTTLERQYFTRYIVDLQHYHWIFLVRTQNGWRLAMMFSRIGNAPDKPPAPPRETSDGVIAEAIEEWLRDCQAGVLRSTGLPK